MVCFRARKQTCCVSVGATSLTRQSICFRPCPLVRSTRSRCGRRHGRARCRRRPAPPGPGRRHRGSGGGDGCVRGGGGRGAHRQRWGIIAVRCSRLRGTHTRPFAAQLSDGSKHLESDSVPDGASRNPTPSDCILFGNRSEKIFALYSSLPVAAEHLQRLRLRMRARPMPSTYRSPAPPAAVAAEH